MQPIRRALSAGYVLALSTTVLIFAGLRSHASSGSSGQPIDAISYACPGENKELKFTFDSAGTQVTVSGIPLSGPIANIPEFHDCQDFILRSDSGLRYDSLYAIFAAFKLRERFAVKAPPDSLAVPGGKVAVFAAATIFSASPRRYEPLGIAPGFNCLFLYRAPGGEKEWGARMVPLKVPDADCARTGIDLTVGTALEVRAVSDTMFSGGDYPAVARWDWDNQNKEQYIGIMCPAAWCEVGRANFVSSPPRPEYVPKFSVIPGQMPSLQEHYRVARIKGWYDRQMLAKSGPNGLIPSGIFGVVIPNPTLDRVPIRTVSFVGGFSIKSVYDKRWINVGAAVVTAPYKDLKTGVNQIYFCRGTAVGCQIPSPASFTTPQMWTPISSCDAQGASTFWGRLGAGPGAQYGCVQVKDHGDDLKALTAPDGLYPGWDIDLPGSARWHWLKTDESAGWYGCQSTSCCRT